MATVGTPPASRCRPPSVWFLAFAWVVLLTALAARAPAAPDDQQRGIALIARAQQLERLLSADTGPFRLRAHVKLYGLVEGTREGEYLLVAASPTQWFDNVRFPGYSELNGMYEGQRWRRRNTVDKPFRFHEVAQLLAPARHLRLPPDAVIKKLTQETIRGVQAFCVEAGPTTFLWQKDSARKAAMDAVGTSKDSSVTLCFDAGTGALMSAMYSPSLPRFEYEGEVALGNKVFPRVLRCLEGKEVVVEATVTDLAAEPNSGPAGFGVPEGADAWPACESPEPPRLVAKKPVDERFLVHARATRSYGTIFCIAEVATDGTVHDLAAVDWRGQLGALVREATKGWRYAPATCNGVPVPVQIYITYSFTP